MKIVMVSGVLALAAFCGSAEAGKYNCEFQKDGTALNKCAVDSASSQVCEYGFSANLRGLCGATGGNGGLVMLVCAITTPVSPAAGFMSGLPLNSASAAAQALAQKPGFVAGGIAIVPDGQGAVAGVYVEKQGAPTLAGVCIP